MEEKELSSEEKKELLRIAREAVTSCFRGGKVEPRRDLEGLRERRGVFVTIHKRGALRGCIGVFTSDKPLYETTAEMAVSAAFRDPRFPPLGAGELDEVDFEISVLSPLREIDDIAEIEIGKHGIYITRGLNRGVLLPQVATEYGWNVETFLEQTCLKAGLPPDAWKKGAKIEIFSAQVFGEKEDE